MSWQKFEIPFKIFLPELPMVIRIGHYYFDNKPLIGKVADIQVWDRMLR